MCGRYFINEDIYDRMMLIAEEAGLPVVNLSGRPSKAGPDGLKSKDNDPFRSAQGGPGAYDPSQFSQGKKNEQEKQDEQGKQDEWEKQDVLPSQKAPVLTQQGFQLMRWGFHMQGTGSLLINARAETASQKKTFSQSLQSRRCIIPAAGYYEWNPAREKVTFRRRDGGLMFFAGLYRYEEEKPRYCILTTQANQSARVVHDRMPLILDKGEIADWLCRPETSALLLKKEPAALDRQQDYEQLSFKFE